MNGTVILLGVLVLLSGLFSALEIGFFSLSEARLRSLAEKKGRVGKQAKLVMKIKQNPQKLLATVVVADNLVDVAAASVATAVAIQWFGSLGVGIATGIMTFLILIVGEIIPKAIAQKRADTIARWFGGFTMLLIYVMTPLTWLFEWIARTVHKLLGAGNTESISKDEVKAMVYMGAEAGTVAVEEQEMIENIFALDDVTSEDAMTQTTDMVTLNLGSEPGELVRIITETGFSRFPAYSGNIDNIAGIIYAKDVMAELLEVGSADKLNMKSLVKPAIFVPEQKPLNSLLQEFQKARKHIAVVVNEFGETRGIVTLEDILEEIVGDIVDEQDQQPGHIKRINSKTIVVDADVSLGQIERVLDVDFAMDTHKTIAWLILSELEALPSKGDELTVRRVKIIIEEAEEQKVKRVKLIKIR